MTIVELINKLDALRHDYGDDAMIEVRNGAGDYDYAQELSATCNQKLPISPRWVVSIDA